MQVWRYPLKYKKWKKFQKKEQILGHSVSEEGILSDPSQIEAIKTWPQPTTLKELRSFLGTTFYYRRFIRGFASIPKPLHKLTENDCVYKWTKECAEDIQMLQSSLTTPTALVYPDLTKTFVLDTDSSGFEIGEWVKGALRPSNAKRLYTDEKSTKLGEVKRRIIGK